MKDLRRCLIGVAAGFFIFNLVFIPALNAEEKVNSKPFGIVIHGGAGYMQKERMPAEKDQQYRRKLEEALRAGYAILEKGGSSLDAVETAVRILEDCPLFNAGKGAVFTSAGTNELDSSIMEGKGLKAGAAAGIKHIQNPISLARLVMERSGHVMLTGEGAETFAKEMGIPLVEEKYFFTEERWKSLQEEQKREKEAAQKKDDENSNKCGTVGAAALDKEGNLAAGTSTGGMTNKKYGRVGDSPIIGAGTYANNRTCAVSSTGYGEYFIRLAAAYDISALMEYKGLSLEAAASLVMEKINRLGGYGGVIAIDSNGKIAMPFTTGGMFRGYLGNDGKIVIKIYKDE